MTTSYLSLAEFRVRSIMPPGDIDALEALAYGPITNTPASGTIIGATNATPIVAQAGAAEGINTGDTVTIASVLGNGHANGSFPATVIDATHLSLGGSSGSGVYSGGGTWSSIGTATISPSRTSPLNAFAIVVKITASGTVGVAGIQWQYSTDGGVTFSGNQALGTSQSIVVPGTGAAFLLSAGTLQSGQSFACFVQPPFIEQTLQDWTAYINDRLKKRYAVPFNEPVPFTVKKWLKDLATKTCYDKRGRNPASQQDQDAIEKPYDQAVTEVKEAADAKDGLFDLPLLDSAPGASAVVNASPLFYSETSPYVGADIEARDGKNDDATISGTDG